LSTELKKELLRLLEIDEEFRLAVAAKLGLREILDELRKLREDFNKLYAKSLEHDKRFEVLEKKLLEHDKRFEAIERKLLEHDKRFESIERRLEEHDRKFNEIIEQIKKIWEVLADHGRRLNRIELVLGVLTESFYSKAVWDDLREVLASRGETIVSRKRRFRIDENEIDLLVETNKAIYVVEVKIRPRHEDVGRLLAKAELVSKRMGKPVIPILAGALIPDDVEEYAVSKGVEVYRY